MLFRILRMEGTIAEKIIYLVMLILVLSFTFSIHEFMHAWVADRMGDDTPRRQGRITLNPVAHIDPMGAIMMLLVGFGWAKPVQYNPNNLHKYKRSTCERLISLAGVFANLMTAFFAALLIPVIIWLVLKFPVNSDKGVMLESLLVSFFVYLREYGFLFMAFNLLPIPPLDGYRFISSFIPYNKRHVFEKYSKYSYYVFMGLFLADLVFNIPILATIVNWVAWPFRIPVDLLVNLIARLLGIPGLLLM